VLVQTLDAAPIGFKQNAQLAAVHCVTANKRSIIIMGGFEVKRAAHAIIRTPARLQAACMKSATRTPRECDMNHNREAVVKLGWGVQ
jgi:hypothetical protein